jgi:hypothetical protein
MTKLENTDSQNSSPREDLPAYALNALTADERRRVEAYLSQYPEAWEELVQYMEAAEHVGLGAPAPAAEVILQVRENILSQADRDIFLTRLAKQEARSVRPGFARRVFGAWLRPARVAYAGTSAALMAVIGLSVVFGLENSRLKSEVDTLRTDVSSELGKVQELRDSVDANSQVVASQESEIARLTAVNAALNEALKNQQWLTYVVQNEEFRVSDLITGGSQAPEATGVLTVSESVADEAVLLVMGLPPAPEGYQYQLWLMRGSIAEPMASFQVNAAGMARVEFKLPADISLYGSAIVTRERTGVEDTGMPGTQVMTASEP